MKLLTRKTRRAIGRSTPPAVKDFYGKAMTHPMTTVAMVTAAVGVTAAVAMLVAEEKRTRKLSKWLRERTPDMPELERFIPNRNRQGLWRRIFGG